MTLRLWHQSVTELRRDTPYSQALVKRARTVLGDEVSVETFGLPAGTYHGRAASVALSNAFIYHRILDRFIDQAIEAERQGYDAFVIGSFSEPFLAEIRSVVDIPVTSVFEASVLVGCSLGSKLALITTSPDVSAMVEKAVAMHHMEARVASILSISPSFEGSVLHSVFSNPAPIMTAFNQTAAKAIEMGADVLIPAEGILAVLLPEQGITRLHNAPVLDVVSVTWSYACMLSRLRSKAGMSFTRRGRYACEDKGLIELISERIA